MVWYSPFIYMIIHLTTMHELDIYHVCSILFNVLVSESPDFFMQVLIQKQSDHRFWKKKDYKSISYTLYNLMWDAKTCSNNTDGQRMAPGSNKKASEEQVHYSVLLIAAMHFALLPLSNEQAFDLHYFDKAVAIFSDSTNGVYHAGVLLSQHLLAIGTCVGVFPLPIATLGEIGDTTRMDYLKSKYGLFCNEQDSSIESTFILRALSFQIKETTMYCENLTCEKICHTETHMHK